MAEDDDSSLDTVMYRHIDATNSTKKVLIPVRLHQIETGGQSANPEHIPEPDLRIEPDFIPADNVEMDKEIPNISSKNTKRQWHYMKEFVSRIDDILLLMQAREALPGSGCCSECSHSVGRWRCRECTNPKLLCRSCMRKTHFSNPFHRIERWTGTYFRRAALWEVGVFLTLPHQHAPNICSNLQWQHKILEMFQREKDGRDDTNDDQAEPNQVSDPIDAEPEPDHDQIREAEQDAATMSLLDDMLEGRNTDDLLEEDDNNEREDADADIQDQDAGASGFLNYIHHRTPEAESDPGSGPTPHQDALNNQYVRVVHTNGIHHIALVCCTCKGKENIVNDLFYASMVPTSFVRIRTIFTTALLDHFRLCNLELRSSAYQFYQVLRRFTMPMAPWKVATLYHELRRLSRLWRWVKKLRWAGYGLKRDQQNEPQPGELSDFCPACPQAGINIPDNWRGDPNRWAFRRVLTADGNFKADHVRQKNQADDIWLYDGMGMTARRSEYKEFLSKALETSTVSHLYSDSDPNIGLG